MDQPTSLVVRIEVGSVTAMIAAEGNGYSPDLVNDMAVQTRRLFGEALLDAITMGYVDGVDLDDDEEDTEETEEEEVTPDGSKWWWVQ